MAEAARSANGEKEDTIKSAGSSRKDKLFDETIGHLQDILIDEKFQKLLNGFMDEHYHHFEDEEENKFIYTDIFNLYTKLIEKHIEDELKTRMPGFSMESFMKSLESRKDEIDLEIFDILVSFTDFLTFKEMLVSYKKAKEGKVPDLSLGLTITPLSSSTNGH
ncbi:ADP-ribosylation factor-like protein 2-binding protein [Dysidea avara]|uniref:ADP-ribosylation factor-like protein 2-binding protein n=1 Tax=Dysidea avara TaxID=196820 RepID=UPI00331DEC4F